MMDRLHACDLCIIGYERISYHSQAAIFVENR